MKATCTSLKYQHILRLVMAGTLSASFAAAATPSASLVLTQQQQQWVAQRAEKPIRYCFNPHWPPFDFQEGGQHRGIFKDYLDLLFQRVGLQGQAILLPSWSAALDAARQALLRAHVDEDHEQAQQLLNLLGRGVAGVDGRGEA